MDSPSSQKNTPSNLQEKKPAQVQIDLTRSKDIQQRELDSLKSEQEKALKLSEGQSPTLQIKNLNLEKKGSSIKKSQSLVESQKGEEISQKKQEDKEDEELKNNEDNNFVNQDTQNLINQYLNRNSLSTVFKQHSINDFTILKSLGQGKFATVYQAVENDTGFLVALKIIDKLMLLSYEMDDMLVQEIKIQSFTDHENIAKLYTFFHDQDNIYLVQEYCEGENLYSEMRTMHSQRFAPSFASQILQPVLKAFKYLHENHIIHRDIKPENILLCNGNIKVIDFGCSVYTKQQKETVHCGTLDYLSPEQVMNLEYGHQIDNWQLGILAYELMHGQSPFAHIQDDKQVYTAIKKGDIKIEKSKLPQEAKNFISSLCQKDPKKRMSFEDALKHPFITQHNDENEIEKLKEKEKLQMLFEKEE